MNNIDSILFTKTFISELKTEGFFNEDDNLFIDEELLYNEVLKHSNENMIQHENPEITVEQFSESIKVVQKIIIQETIDGLIEKGLVEPTAVDNDGEFLYSLSDSVIIDNQKK